MHFYAFDELSKQNDFGKRIAFYSISDPVRRRRLLESLAAEFGVPLPDWEFPPVGFDHEATMEWSDPVLLVGNSYTLETFPRRWRHKIRLLNYAVEAAVAFVGVGSHHLFAVSSDRAIHASPGRE